MHVQNERSFERECIACVHPVCYVLQHEVEHVLHFSSYAMLYLSTGLCPMKTEEDIIVYHPRLLRPLTVLIDPTLQQLVQTFDNHSPATSII